MWVWYFLCSEPPYGPTKAEARMVVAYADTTKNGPSTEADTSRTKEFLRVRIVRLLTLWSRKARAGSVNLRSTLAVEAYISRAGVYPTPEIEIEPARGTNPIGSHARVPVDQPQPPVSCRSSQTCEP